MTLTPMRLVIFTLFWVATRAQRTDYKSRCGFENPDDDDILRDESNVEAYKKALGAQRLSAMREDKIVVKTHIHVLYESTGTGYIENDVITKQMEVLNEAYAGTNTESTTYPECANFYDGTDDPLFEYGETIDTSYQFEMVGDVNYVQNDEAFILTSDEFYYELTTTLRQGGCDELNVFFGDMSYLGFGTFPMYCNHYMSEDGVFINYMSVPDDSSFANYNEGDTLVHEVGHWLGLLHTFEYGCEEVGGDNVEDTPAQNSSSWGCPVGRDSCPFHDGVDPIHNFMDYSHDCCMYQFTAGQVERMWLRAGLYRQLGNPLLTNDCEAGTSEFLVQVTTDYFPNETTWELSSTTKGTVIGSGGIYFLENYMFVYNFCLKASCYKFVISDLYDDGLCCDNGFGSYAGYVNGINQFWGDKFGTNSIHYFCTEGDSSSPSQLPSNELSTSPSQTPSDELSNLPSQSPSNEVSNSPSQTPSNELSNLPSQLPTNEVSNLPSQTPSNELSNLPSQSPSNEVSNSPSQTPSNELSNSPSQLPSNEVSNSPSQTPSNEPLNSSNSPSQLPSNEISNSPSQTPSNEVSNTMSPLPSNDVSNSPSQTPSNKVSIFSSQLPSNEVSNSSSQKPSNEISNTMSQLPSNELSNSTPPLVWMSLPASVEPLMPMTPSPMMILILENLFNYVYAVIEYIQGAVTGFLFYG